MQLKSANRVFVINLARRPDRLGEISADLARHGLSFERIEAVDGGIEALVSPYRRPILARLYGPLTYTNSYIANLLSHRAIWQKMVDENISQALIFEDDAIVNNWEPRFMDLSIADHGLDILRLGANRDIGEKGTKNIWPTGHELFGRKLHEGNVWGAIACLITLQGARKCLRIRPYWFPSDHYEIYRRCFGVNVALVEPLIWKASGSKSDVLKLQHEQSKKGLRHHVLRFQKRLLLRPLVLVLQLYYRWTRD
jgi:GR25 family glycosyltransferase involved in LPS biosynthesis